jgi:prepilin-type N-terminal cleavage/methylation domain-containing protein
MKRGLTLVELLIVVAIIAILTTLAAAGVNIARSKARDAKRSADAAQLQRAFSLYATSFGKYPVSTSVACITGEDVVSAELKAKGAMAIVPSDPIAKSTLPADAGANAHCYAYQSATGAMYELKYYQERASDRGPAGTVTVRP